MNHLLLNLNFRRRGDGMSLVELMISLALGLLLVAGVIQLFLGSRMTYTSGEALARVQENGRFALEILKPPLRAAGSGSFCAGQVEVNNRLRPECPGFVDAVFNRPLIGWEFLGTGPDDEYTVTSTDPTGVASASWRSGTDNVPVPPDLVGRVVPGTDFVTIRNLELCVGVEIGSTQGNNLHSSSPHCVSQYGLGLVTDCATGADFFQNTATSAGTLTAGTTNCQNPGPGNNPPGPNPWSTDHGPGSQVYTVNIQTYYIGYSQPPAGSCAQPALGGQCGEPGLWRLRHAAGSSGAAHEELVRGVENMQILYGVSLPAGDGRSVDEWETADQVQNWEQVIALHAALVVRSPENADPSGTVRTFELAAIGDLDPVVIDHTEDRRLRHAFDTTIAVRNQLRR